MNIHTAAARDNAAAAAGAASVARALTGMLWQRLCCSVFAYFVAVLMDVLLQKQRAN